MGVYRVSELIHASLVTGPTHNYLNLGICARSGAAPAIEIVDLCPRADAPSQVTSDEVKTWVLQAVEEFAPTANREWDVIRIEYKRHDSHSPPAYRRLVQLIIQHHQQSTGRPASEGPGVTI